MHWGVDHLAQKALENNKYEGFVTIPHIFERYDARGWTQMWIWLEKSELMLREWSVYMKEFTATESVYLGGVNWHRTTRVSAGRVRRMKLISTLDQRVASNRTFGGGGTML